MSRRRRLLRRVLAAASLLLVGAAGVLLLATRRQLLPLPDRLPPAPSDIAAPQVRDRYGEPLSVSFQNRWNVHQQAALHELPPLLRDAFVVAEDKRFFEHHGADWRARGMALLQNLKARRKVRGASTITEQVVRILHPRPRTLWSRWVEGFEAGRLETRFTKGEILRFYLNQVPYARQRRGVVQAARTYFDRDLDTLSTKEILALAVLVRSPSRLDLERGTAEIEVPLLRLARRMHNQGLLEPAELESIESEPLVVVRPRPPVDAGHFVRFVQGSLPHGESVARIDTTLDASLQRRIQSIVDRRVRSLAERQVADAAILVVDHTSDEILAWVNAGGHSQRPGGMIDKVLTPRQPGSTLKPFVYALAMERGWTAATLIEDAPLHDAVGHGLHRYRNYSRLFYGPLRLREALGNSLNTPAVRAARFVGNDRLLERLRRLGFSTLREHPDFYGDGLALGNGEVTLYDLVSAYATLARNGIARPLRAQLDDIDPGREERILDPTISSLLADILSDAGARGREFGRHSVLELPVQTAVKTGTSNDYRDAWTVGFSGRYTVGVWMGNVDRREMREVSGAVGPALVLRSVFAELHRHRPPPPFEIDRELVRRRICRITGARAHPECPSTDEWFRPSHVPPSLCPVHGTVPAIPPSPGPLRARLESPTPGLHLARDPRIPDDLEAFPFRIDASFEPARVEWIVNGSLVATSDGPEHLWPLAPGHHIVEARAFPRGSERFVETQQVGFLVK